MTAGEAEARIAMLEESLGTVAAEAEAARVENARLANDLEAARAELDEARASLAEARDDRDEAIAVGAELAGRHRGVVERVRDADRVRFGSRSESSAGAAEQRSHYDGGDAGLVACEYFESRAAAAAATAEGEPEAMATGAEAFSQMSEEELQTLPEDVRAEVERERAAQAARDEAEEMLEEWVYCKSEGERAEVERRARADGVPLQERLASLDHRWVLAMPDGGLEEFASREEAEEAARAIAESDPALRRFMSFDERTEVEHVPATCSCTHVLRPRYKAKDRAETDADARRDVAEALAGSPGLRVCEARKGRADDGLGERLRDVFVSTRARCALIRGSVLTPSLAAAMIVALVVAAVPVRRQLAAPGLFGISWAAPSTAGGWMTLLWRRKLRHLMPLLREELVSNSLLHADETPIRTLRTGEDAPKKCYMWLYSTPVGAERAVRYFSWAPGRAGKFAVEALRGFAGWLVTDAYAGYNLLKGVLRAFCLIHARRPFFEAAVASTVPVQAGWANRIVAAFDRVFEIERGLAHLDPDERLRERRSQVAPVVKVIDDLCEKASEDPCVSKKGKLARAIAYWQNNHDELTAFLEDGELPTHNMVAEGMARTVGVYRRGSLFCGSPDGAEARACALTLVETARANGLDPQSYLEFVLEGLREPKSVEDVELLRTLMPWSDEARAACRPLARPGRRGHSLVGGGVAA